jgi:hypothetical protein
MFLVCVVQSALCVVTCCRKYSNQPIRAQVGYWALEPQCESMAMPRTQPECANTQDPNCVSDVCTYMYIFHHVPSLSTWESWASAAIDSHEKSYHARDEGMGHWSSQVESMAMPRTHPACSNAEYP